MRSAAMHSAAMHGNEKPGRGDGLPYRALIIIMQWGLVGLFACRDAMLAYRRGSSRLM
ncbi:hypothetical protein HHA02_16490 [Cobetia marina]|nr:hypothetical protein HHA02_16490 [Cobetia marina]